MTIVIITLSKYIITLIMAVYTLQCFSVFRYSNEQDRNGIYIRQDCAICLMYFIAFMVMYLYTGDKALVPFYLLTQLILISLIMLYRFM
ncbi:MAG: FtsW/RodA/SpoVE family cell cycle protein, partial [Lachnospiraceae bacterium]|nr:FtsW/RodA/SpoVE family cell cycle protein [Lachnospiraceae bacterium]